MSDGIITGGIDEDANSASVCVWGAEGPCEKGALKKVLDALETFGVTKEEREDLLKGVSAVLHLGRVSTTIMTEDLLKGISAVSHLERGVNRVKTSRRRMGPDEKRKEIPTQVHPHNSSV